MYSFEKNKADIAEGIISIFFLPVYAIFFNYRHVFVNQNIYRGKKGSGSFITCMME